MLSAPATRDGFLLRIGAAGIRDEPILPGDLVVLRPQAVAVAAQLIARRGAGGITIARATGEENDVVGQVVGLIRRY
jgi:SOS-response transcriptional repressor LexA